MGRWRGRLLSNILFFMVGSLMTGGVVFAASGTWIQAFYQSATIYNNNNSNNSNNTFTTSTSQLQYNGVSYIDINDLMSVLQRDGIPVSWDGQNLTVFNAQTVYYPAPSSQISSSATVNNANQISMFDYPQFAQGSENVAGSTAIYTDYVDNLGYKYDAATMSWGLTGTTTSSSSSTSSGITLGNAAESPYGTQVFNHHIGYLTFAAQDGSKGTFSTIYNLNDNYNYFTATLSPSAYFNNVPVNNNVGSLEIVNEQTGAILYDSGDISSDNYSPIPVDVSINGVNQIKVIFTTDGLGLINPLFVK